MPGFINTHAHVPMVLWRGLGEDVNLESWFNDYIWRLEANLQPEDVYWGMQLGLLEMIEAGVTAVSDHYWHMNHAARAVEKAGTRALLGQAMFGSNSLAQIDETAAFVARWQGQAAGRIRAIMAPHAPYTCDDDFLIASANKAEAIGSGIHIHVAETVEQTQASLGKAWQDADRGPGELRHLQRANGPGACRRRYVKRSGNPRRIGAAGGHRSLPEDLRQTGDGLSQPG